MCFYYFIFPFVSWIASVFGLLFCQKYLEKNSSFSLIALPFDKIANELYIFERKFPARMKQSTSLTSRPNHRISYLLKTHSHITSFKNCCDLRNHAWIEYSDPNGSPAIFVSLPLFLSLSLSEHFIKLNSTCCARTSGHLAVSHLGRHALNGKWLLHFVFAKSLCNRYSFSGTRTRFRPIH